MVDTQFRSSQESEVNSACPFSQEEELHDYLNMSYIELPRPSPRNAERGCILSTWSSANAAQGKARNPDIPREGTLGGRSRIDIAVSMDRVKP